MQLTKSQAIKAFLMHAAPADLAGLYNHDMEVQVNVAQDDGERVQGDYKGKLWLGYTDGIQTWKPVRIPLFANTEPEYTDTPMSYNLVEHAEGIGMTGWDWKSRLSRWVAFDFDAILGHSDKHTKKLSDLELEQIVKSLESIPCVTIRKSTGGKGLHLYVFLEPTPTANHNEHAAVARAILSQLSGLAGFDFGSKVDICGGNMWVWHRKMAGTDGLTVVKQGTELTTVPANWRDYTKVVTGRRSRNLPRFIEEQANSRADIEDVFAELTGQRLRVKPDEEHKKLMNWLFDNYGGATWWDAENHMLVTHTYLLKLAHEALSLRGRFETEATGTEKGFDHNAYMFPMGKGAWAVRRFSIGVKEHCFWEQDGQQWTRCFTGDTEILTDRGIFSLDSSLGSRRVQALTPEGLKFVEAEIKFFGEQEVWDVVLTSGEVIQTTATHQWLVMNSRGVLNLGDRKSTYELKKHDHLPLAQVSLPDFSTEGYLNGFIFGDGWIHSDGNYCDVELYGGKMDLLDDLLEHGRYGTREKYGQPIPVVRGLPVNWKQIPDFSEPKEYLLGFILGVIASDGNVRGASITITNKEASNLQKIRRLCQYVGLRAYQIRQHGTEMHAMNISSSNLTKHHFLRRDQRDAFRSYEKDKMLTVQSVVRTGIVKNVYCAVVPFYRNFTLANGIVTGNCFFNQELSLPTAARIYNGLEDQKGGFHFSNAEDAQNAAILLGANLGLPNRMLTRKTKMVLDKQGRLVVEVARDNNDAPIDGWISETKKFVRIFVIRKPTLVESEVQQFDDVIRHIVTEGGDDCGWVIKADGNWNSEPYQHVKTMLTGMGHKQQDVATIMSANIRQYWTLVNKPFKEEYPKDRQWNRGAAQFRYKPSIDKDRLAFPTWLKILSHCGRGLDNAVAKSDWCKQHGILAGADWLKCWIASLFQEPTEPLPYLFFYSPEQNTGKSIFHEALSLLMTSGVARADNALMSQSGFNGELEHAVLCAVEETDLHRNKIAYNRIKDWVTSRMLPIHKKQRQPYTILNTTHWVQTGNSHLMCPVFPGDTRITMICVSPLAEGEMIPKKAIIPMLEKEASDFLADILALELPTSNDRLNIPCLMTDDKAKAELDNQSDLDFFITEYCSHAPGFAIKYEELWDRFFEKLDANQASKWTKQRMGKELPPMFVKGRLKASGQYWIGNIAFGKVPPDRHGNRIALDDKMTLFVPDENKYYSENPRA